VKLLLLYTKNRQEVFNIKSAIGSYVYYLGNVLNQNGFEVYLNGQKLTEIDYTQHHSPSISSSKLAFIKRLVPSSIKRFLREKRHLQDIDVFTDELKINPQEYDAILEYYNLGSNVGLNISKYQNIPLFIFYDGPVLDEYRIFNHSNPFFFKEVVKREVDSFAHAKKVVAQSNPMKDYVLKNICNVPDKIYIHQNVDYTKFDVLKKDKVFNFDDLNIGFIGSFLPWHQVDLLVNAFKFILEEGVNANLYLVGDGMEREKIETYCKTLPKVIKDKIIFTGFVKEKELLDIKLKLDIGVMSGSNWYGAPLKIFEYGAMKLACIAPDTPTIKDLFPNNEVLYFKWKNQQSLNEALLDLCQNPNKIRENSKVLHHKITQKYSEQNTINFYKSLIE